MLPGSLAAQNNGLTTHVHARLDFVITLPTDWEVKQDPVDYVAMAAFSPVRDTADPFREFLTVVVESTRGKTFSEFMLETEGGFQADLTGYEVTDRDRRFVNGVEMARLIYTYQHRGYDLQAKTFCMLLNDRGYVVTCTALASDFDRWHPTFNKITASFEFKAKPPENGE